MTVARPRPVTSLPHDVPPEVRAGNVLAGDDFQGEQLTTWFAQEQEAYYQYGHTSSSHDPWYAYMRYVNERLGFVRIARDLPATGSMLVIGPGSGEEVERFSAGHPGWTLCFLEASTSFRAELRQKWPAATIVDPAPSGTIALPDASQHLVCAFSVLHHIPNVSAVIHEAHRVLAPGGFFLVREPCSSMGDWRYAREATPNERGISRRLLTDMAERAGFAGRAAATPILYEPINKILKRTIGFAAVPFGVLFALDRLVSRALVVNDQYWRDAWYKKLAPSSYFYVFQKPAAR